MTKSVANSSPLPSRIRLPKTMKSLVNHLLRYDLKQQRMWLYPLWFLCVVIGVIGVSMKAEGILPMLHVGLVFIAAILCLACIIAAILSASISESSAWWRTRPIDRRELLSVKLRFAFIWALSPLFAALLLGWIANGFTMPQLLAAAFEFGLYLTTGVAVVGAVAALGGSAKGLTITGGSFIGVVMIWSIILERTHSEFRMILRPIQRETGAMQSTLIVGLLLLLVGALYTWGRYTLRGDLVKSGAGFAIALLLFPPLIMLRPVNFLAPDTAGAQVKLEVIRTKELPVTHGPDEQLIYSHFLATDLPTNSMLYVEGLAAEFHTQVGDVRVDAHHSVRKYETLAKQLKDHRAEANLMDALQRQYPAETRWSGDWSVYSGNSLPVRGTYPKPLRLPVAKGTFQGLLNYSVVQFERIADLPLRPGGQNTDYGIRIGITRAKEQNNEIDIRILEASPQLLISSEPSHSGGYRNGTRCIYVIHHPESGESFPIEGRNIGQSESSPFDCRRATTVSLRLPHSRLREALTGTTDGNWTAGLRLHAFLPKRVGTGEFHFAEKNYEYLSYRRDRRDPELDTSTGEWPGAENPEAALSYVRQFLQESQNMSSRAMSARRKKLEAIGPALVPFILAAVPVNTGTYYNFSQSVLRRYIQREHLPQLKKMLPIEPKLATIVRTKKWGTDCLDVLEKMATDRDRPMHRDALRLLATHASPKHYPDLAWHAERVVREEVFAMLQKLPGFPYERTVRRAWVNSRIDVVRPERIAVFAAGLGVKDALYAVVRQLSSQHFTESQRKITWNVLESHLAHPGDRKAKESWLKKNAALLKWSAEKRQWIEG
jgi:hypothetical protein